MAWGDRAGACGVPRPVARVAMVGIAGAAICRHANRCDQSDEYSLGVDLAVPLTLPSGEKDQINLAEPLRPIGFWSYTISDDASSRGRLSQLRRLLADELQLAIGRRRKVEIFQDVAAIQPGEDWLETIKQALAESSFLIPVVTPGFLESEFCCREVMLFREREQTLGRGHLMFPVLYVDVADVEPHEVHDPAVLALLKTRQWIDFAALRYRPADAEDVVTKVAALAGAIRSALRRTAPPGPAVRQDEPSAEARVPPSISRLQRATENTPAMTRGGPEPEMVLIPAGTFLMGVPKAESEREGTDDDDARPQHQVSITR
ncbi:MAG: cobaltochelatase CobT, partial [Solirubrobacterales bacterium]|nr:cobaltochelatase CobT [Solirubrobacterales bacterium]